ncbi:DUF2806 domain-containing protein [Lysobacter sp. MMG2]|uniref:DUF2806 domain-containing protein n=1 Tax=Lysobacter sp. MMG2 TaxID=2801338 RepID=UPI001C247847|nr:DUF2806 domain-containing protein [Lysobacter sp. MMG2]MBU8975900.1 DUF2806 domain-containing protein [Lysobacter sp. MMG2]
MGDSNSIVNIDAKGLSKVGAALVEKVADGIGGVFRPTQLVRVARAQAKADLIAAQSQVEINELQARAMQRFVAEESKRQSNIEEITRQAIPLLEDKSEPERMDDDWVANFFDKSRIVSDNEMQGLWSRILAGESNSPGKFSKRTINLLSDLDKSDAELFANLVRFCWMIAGPTVLIFDLKDSIYSQNGIHFAGLAHLESLGLVHLDNLGGYQRNEIPAKFAIHYRGRPLAMEVQPATEDFLPLGHCLLTNAGMQLAEICQTSPVEGFFEYVQNKYAAKGFRSPSAV